MSLEALPVRPPVKPMLAKATGKLPETDARYDPKWDGFRAIVFRSGDELEIGSRNERPLTRYFPEIVEPLKQALPARCVLDGELVVAAGEGLDFDALQQRIHPAQSRIVRLAGETPAAFVAFDVLALGDRDLRGEPLSVRREILESILAVAEAPVYLSPSTLDVAVARDWFVRFEGAGLDGVVAKPLAGVYQEDKRGWLKLKHSRTADCVVGGYRLHKNGGVGSLLLGLYDAGGSLRHVGVASSFKESYRHEMVEFLAPYEVDAGVDHPWVDAAKYRQPDARANRPGMVSRWNAGKDLSFEPVRIELVVEVGYDQIQGHRFRRVAKLLRFRDDRDPGSCEYAQLDVATPAELNDLFGAG